MRTLAPPDPKLWQARADWFWRAHDANAGPHPLDLTPQEALLVAELESVFCAGAWAATIILAWTLVEAEQRARARRDPDPRPDPEADWLRARRNALAHVQGGAAPSPQLDEDDLERAAQGAVRVAFKTLFQRGWS